MVKEFVFYVLSKNKELTTTGTYHIYAETKRKAKKQAKELISKKHWKTLDIREHDVGDVETGS
jgi:hypothetical protein